MNQRRFIYKKNYIQINSETETDHLKRINA